MKPSALATAQQAPFWQVATTLGRDKARLSNVPHKKFVLGDPQPIAAAYVKRGKPVRITRGAEHRVFAAPCHCDRSAKSVTRKLWVL